MISKTTRCFIWDAAISESKPVLEEEINKKLTYKKG